MSVATDLQTSCGLPTSVSDPTNVFLEQRSKMSLNTLLNLLESLPRRVESMIAKKEWAGIIVNPWIKNGRVTSEYF